MQTSASRRFRHAAGLIAVATAATACAWQSGGGTVREDVRPAEYRVGMIGKQPGGTPVDGGTLTVAAYAEAGLLDPAETIVAGTTGGIEMAAVYDVLMRWDPESGEVVPQLAESLESADDGTTWTLKLRDGVKFSDGTELDAAAVKWSLDRYVRKGADEAALWKENVRAVKTPDDRTVVFELAHSWPSFSFMLTSGPGMIVAKSSDKGEKFEPVGAGPFTFERYAPDEEMVLKANDRYRDGRPHLDRVRLVYVDDPDAPSPPSTAGGSRPRSCATPSSSRTR
nr:ABC transporter substrate-binding protein [Actinomadura sp. CNU-125]